MLVTMWEHGEADLAFFEELEQGDGSSSSSRLESPVVDGTGYSVERRESDVFCRVNFTLRMVRVFARLWVKTQSPVDAGRLISYITVYSVVKSVHSLTFSTVL